MTKSLVIVESPTKAKTINKILGKEYIVRASKGHVMDLPKKRFGIDIEQNFEPEYLMIQKQRKTVDELKEISQKTDRIYLASDPDREGEAICKHLHDLLDEANPKIMRVLFHEITSNSVMRAFEESKSIDMNKVNAQQARRVLDRIVGYKLSPLLWKKVQRGLSAGRVQSVALRLICDREKEIRAFVPEEYWTIEVELEASEPPKFKAKLDKKEGKKFKVPDEKTAHEIVEAIKKSGCFVKSVESKPVKRKPAAPFITSTLQQEGIRKLRTGANRIMRLAQNLYEGKDLGEHGTTGLITYMRTDSPRLSKEIVKAGRDYIKEQYGAEYLPARPPSYKSRKSAQEAHEAIRPTSLELTPDVVAPYLDTMELRLYKLIWNRFLASQMSPMKLEQKTVRIVSGPYELKAEGIKTVFDGFTKVYSDSSASKKADDKTETVKFPEIKKGEELGVTGITPTQNFTKPPPRFSEASLVKELEEQAIGRPSTYAVILQILRNRQYVEFHKQKYLPTELGMFVADVLVEYFPNLMDVKFTAALEKELDLIEAGKLNWKDSVSSFYKNFIGNLHKAEENLTKSDNEWAKTDITCQKCGKTMLIKYGRSGPFLACSGFPECTHTMNYQRTESGKPAPKLDEKIDRKCPECEGELVVKSGRFGRFVACSAFPDCRYTEPVKTGVSCPKPECDGELIERKGRKGFTFYGCSKYPECRYTIRQMPYKEKCPDCGHPFLVLARRKNKKPLLKCPNKQCSFSRPFEEE